MLAHRPIHDEVDFIPLWSLVEFIIRRTTSIHYHLPLSLMGRLFGEGGVEDKTDELYVYTTLSPFGLIFGSSVSDQLTAIVQRKP